jgi:predicted secreted Zn-dependent protease
VRLFILFVWIASLSGKPDNDVIIWTSQTKLTWSDFKEKEQKQSDHVAMSKCGISMKTTYPEGKRAKPEYSVFAYFEPNASWYIHDKVDGQVLQHEQLHFDIAGLFAIKMNRVLNGKAFTPSHARHTFDRLFATYKQTQQQYDNETKNGLDKMAQKRWEKFIYNQLLRYAQD